ncbi:uncharacterized protein LOC135847380 [Planococcus citri]|uniref:uncharacterized protein LOC135847380 n=1 Tax=Planococcus citri TaxID=170843 RepID=UPI0031F954DE
MMTRACVLVAAILGVAVQIVFVKVSLNEFYGDADQLPNYKYFLIIQIVSAVFAIYGILRKERLFIASHLILQGALFATCMIFLVILEINGPPDCSIAHPYEEYIITDKQEIRYLLETQFAVTAGFTLLVLAIVLLYCGEIRREKKKIIEECNVHKNRTPKFQNSA